MTIKQIALATITILTFTAGALTAKVFFTQPEHYLYQQGEYQLTQSNANDLLTLAEYIASAEFSQKDKVALQAWAIEDFKSNPKLGMSFYKQLATEIIPKTRSTNSHTYRAELYLAYVNAAKDNPLYTQFNNDILELIDHYNPPVNEALQLQQVQFDLTMQQLQLSQQLLDQNFKTMQQAHTNINQKLNNQMRRHAISLSGDKALYETDEAFYVENNEGQTFRVSK